MYNKNIMFNHVPYTTYAETFAATQADIFDGTDFEKINNYGWILIQATTVNVADTISIPQAGPKGFTNHMPLIGAVTGAAPEWGRFPPYIIWNRPNQKNKIDLTLTGAVTHISAIFIKTKPSNKPLWYHPAVINQPDIIMFKHLGADGTSDLLAGTCLEDVGMKGQLLVYASSDQSGGVAAQYIEPHGMQGHHANHNSILPDMLGGMGVWTSNQMPYRIPKARAETPVIEINDPGSEVACALVEFYSDEPTYYQ